MADRQCKRVNILGVGICATNPRQTHEIIDAWVRSGERHYLCVTSVNGVIESQRDEKIRRIHNRADLAVPDGMPLVWLSHIHGFRDVERVYGPDLMLDYCARSVQGGTRHYLYGGDTGVPEKLAENLVGRFPGLKIVGMYSPPFRKLTSEEEQNVVQEINEACPDVIWVGLSTPKQELWMAEHVDKLCAKALIGVGAAFDLHAGIKKQAPIWMRRHGLEWLFRLLTEPRRLWRRYLIYNPIFVGLVFLQILGLKKYSLD